MTVGDTIILKHPEPAPEPTPETMGFAEAMKLARAGRPVRRLGWGRLEGYCVVRFNLRAALPGFPGDALRVEEVTITHGTLCCFPTKPTYLYSRSVREYEPTLEDAETADWVEAPTNNSTASP